MRNIIRVILFITTIIWGNSVFSACWLTGGDSNFSTPNIGVIDISGSFSLPDEFKLGSGPYSAALLSMAKHRSVSCDQSGDFYISMTANPMPVETPHNFTWEGKTYKTQINNLDIFLTHDVTGKEDYVPGCNSTTVCDIDANSNASTPLNTSNISFVKNGNGIVHPGIINAASLPTISVKLGQKGNMVEIERMTFTGTMILNIPTCQTPNVTTDLGAWNINNFKGISSVTEWRDTSIKMINCDTFNPGRYDVYYGDIGELRPNQRRISWNLTLTPMFGAVDSTQGIAAMQPGDKSASGVGIQIAYALSYPSLNNAELFDFNSSKSAYMPIPGESTITIPLMARYIQTEDTVSPGRADSKVQFTITYK